MSDLDHTFTRHRGPITCATHIPRSNKIITSGYDSAVALFNYTSMEVELLGYHEHLVNRVSVDADGKFAATASSDYNVYIWDLHEKKVKTILRGHNDDVEDFVFLSDSRGASVSRDTRIIVWDLNNGAIEKIILGHEKDVLSINHCNGKLYTSGDDMTLRVWDVETGMQLNMIGPFETETDTCAIDPSRNRIVLGCDDGFVRIFDLQNGELLKEIAGHHSAIKKVAVSPVTGDILSAAYDQKIQIWDNHSFALVCTLSHHKALWERSFNWSADGKQIIAGSFDGTVLIWSAESGLLLDEIGDKTREGNACFNDLAAKNDRELVVVSDDGIVRDITLTPQESHCNQEKRPDQGRILMNAIAWSPTTRHTIAGAHNQCLYFFPERSATSNLEVRLNEGPLNCLRVATIPDYQGDIFAACYSGTVVNLSGTGSIKQRLAIHPNAVKALALHPGKPIGVSCCAEGTLRAWYFDGEIIADFKAHTAIIDDVDISPSGRFIASAGRDFTLKIHDLNSGLLCANIPLGNRSPKALCFINDDTVIVTNYWGELLQVVISDEKVSRKTIAQNGISGIAIINEHIAVTSYDGSVYLVNPGSLDVINRFSAMTQRVESICHV
ncbi:WD40 repeat domain-containing protein [Planctobacterium marinum]|uniref:Repetitive protein n=1 Tax=Planctobacterium marinum TaxID=1631968 RepID=A0AA48KND7_9ALTE|nr:repetitive protein [Planctobacterium marinum]